MQGKGLGDWDPNIGFLIYKKAGKGLGLGSGERVMKGKGLRSTGW